MKNFLDKQKPLFMDFSVSIICQSYAKDLPNLHFLDVSKNSVGNILQLTTVRLLRSNMMVITSGDRSPCPEIGRHQWPRQQ